MTKPVYVNPQNKIVENTLRALRKARKEFLKSPKKAKEFLLRLGFHTPTGRLKKAFK